MGRPIRHFDPDTYYHVSNRCFQDRFLLRPDPETNRIILGCLTRAARIHRIDLVCFVFLSNRFHIVLRTPLCNLHEFMRDFQSTLATRINQHRGRTGSVFGGRYSCQTVLDDDALRETIAEVLTQPVLASLVTHLDHWPGVSSWSAHQTGGCVTGQFLDRTLLRDLRRLHPDISPREAMCEFGVELSLPPYLDEIDDRQQAHQTLVEDIERRRRKLRQGLDPRERRVMGAKAILRRDWSDRPDEPTRRTRSLCRASDPDDRIAWLSWFEELMDFYHECVEQVRQRRRDVPFPTGTIPPGWIRCVADPGRRFKPKLKPA